MCNFKRVNGQYIVTYKNEDYIFAAQQHAWAFIFTIYKEAHNNV